MLTELPTGAASTWVLCWPLNFLAFSNNSKKRPLSVKTFDEVPVEKEKVMHEVSEVIASFPPGFTDHLSPAPETVIRAFEICLLQKSFKSSRRFGPSISHIGLCDNKEGPAFSLRNNLKRSSCMIILALIRLRGFILRISIWFFPHKKMAAHWNGAFWRKCVQNTFWLAETANNLVVVRIFSSGWTRPRFKFLLYLIHMKGFNPGFSPP